MSTAVTGRPDTRPEPEQPRIRDRADKARQLRLVVTFAIVAAVLVLLALLVDDPQVSYILGERVTRDEQPRPLNGRAISWAAVAVAALALVLAALNRYPRGPAGVALGLLVGVMTYLGFLMWAYADQGEGFVSAIANPVPGTVRIATPIVLGALAGVLCERAGVINIAIEGQFLAGAFFAAVAASLAYQAYTGLLGGILAGVGIAALLGLFALRYQVNQVVLGVVLVALASGLTSFLLGQIPGDPDVKQYFNEPPTLPRLRIPGLAEIPVIGDALFNQTLLVYLMYLSVAAVTFLLYQTRWGLRVRSVGEHPKAADTVGIKVNRTRWQAVLLGGVFAGLGGAYYTVGSTGAFDRDVSAGTGFIALAAVIMGRWHPLGATAAAVFFGFMLNLQTQISFVDKLPSELLGAAPYLATIIAVAGFVGRVRPPAADGEPYVKS
ncbi:MAG: Nucleoside ABC transporter, permease protein 2 [uncultured Nocardioidaceae bacterium]|uniref:Nucleoside ABC transporter, permease protein 2 n=1 Tax=uncultured Nocardioidaceae bacterium TaxID=253824 RepID=A0A6J4LRD8_9ACTN|nr:MAG: Nucleoside ABC transporter, permease protein 2 [uncultured Nocardioidaceae bacterium]